MAAITLNMIVKNEEALLPGCLKSVRDFVDDIIIIDTGSTDDSIGIAESFGANTQRFTWCDDFSAARNYALSFVRTPWTLWLDADDLVENPHYLPELIKAAKENPCSGYWSIYKQDQTCQQRRLSLFKTKEYTWKGVVHEGLVPANSEDSPTRLSNLVVLHRKPATRTAEAARKYLDILLAKDPENWFGIAESYRFLTHHPDDPTQERSYIENALAYYNQALKHPNINQSTRYISYINLALLALKQFESTDDRRWLVYMHKAAHAAVQLDSTRSEGWSLQAQAEFYNGDLANASESCEYALMAEKPEDTTGLFLYDYYYNVPKTLKQMIHEHGVAQ